MMDESAAQTANTAPPRSDVEVVGRYVLSRRIGVGGMGSVHLALMHGAAGFSRVVAVKRLHPQFADDALFAARFKDEVRLSSRVLHPNVVQTLDVVESDGELLLVMEYVDGETLQALLTDSRSAASSIPIDVVVGIMTCVLHGLHAAHGALDDEGHPLNVIHRDVSPQNIMIGRDGQVKVLDFGIAKARSQSHASRTGHVAGKLCYMAPEQICGGESDRRTDVFAAGIVLWEALTGEPLFRGPGLEDTAVWNNVLHKPIPSPSSLRAELSLALDRVVLRALDRDPTTRYQSARELALALEATINPAAPSKIGAVLESLCATRLAARASTLAAARRGGQLPGLAVDAALGGPTEVQTQLALTWPRSRTSIPMAPGSRPRRAGLAAVLVVGLAFSVVLGLSLRRSDLQSTVHAATTAAPAVSPPSASRPAPPALARAAPRSTPSPAAASPPPSAAQAASAAPPRSKSRPRRKPPSAAPACDPPTYLGEDGIRHFKEGCL